MNKILAYLLPTENNQYSNKETAQNNRIFLVFAFQRSWVVFLKESNIIGFCILMAIGCPSPKYNYCNFTTLSSNFPIQKFISVFFKKQHQPFKCQDTNKAISKTLQSGVLNILHVEYIYLGAEHTTNAHTL